MLPKHCIQTLILVLVQPVLAGTVLGGSHSWFFASTGPTPDRSNHALCYDPERDRVVLFGGLSEGVWLGDTWEWEGTSWSIKDGLASAPSPRQEHAMAYDSIEQECILFGGLDLDTELNDIDLDDTWTWDGNECVKISIDGAKPAPRFDHAMTGLTSNGTILLYGGGRLNSNAEVDDAWIYDGNTSTWTDEDLNNPGVRWRAEWRGRPLIESGERGQDV